MRTTKLIQAAIVSAILITEGNVGTQIYAESFAILSKPNQKKTALPLGCATDSKKFAVTSDALEKLIDAIAIVESNGHTNIMGDQNRAAGAWQLHRGAIEHTNQRCKTNYVWPQDALNPVMARQIAKSYLIICGYEKKSLEKTVRCYNGGSKGYKKKSTKKYWEKVKKKLR